MLKHKILFLKQPTTKFAEEILQLDRKQIRLTTRLITGNSGLKKKPHILGILKGRRHDHKFWMWGTTKIQTARARKLWQDNNSSFYT